jgi:hypothetical protein
VGRNLSFDVDGEGGQGLITYSKASLKVGEFYFKEEAAPVGLDIVRYQARLEPVEGSACEQRHTILMNLGLDEAALFSAMNRTTRYQISRSEKENINCVVSLNPDEEVMAAFAAFWAVFAPSKGLPALNVTRVNGMRAAGSLALSRAVSDTGETLVWHSYIRTGEWARLLHSASLFRSADADFGSLVARANRMLHWHDMKTFRQQGQAIYDFGGWYGGQTDQGLLNINRFKEGFGGEVVPVYYADQASSLRGSVALGLKRLWSKS